MICKSNNDINYIKYKMIKYCNQNVELIRLEKTYIIYIYYKIYTLCMYVDKVSKKQID